MTQPSSSVPDPVSPDSPAAEASAAADPEAVLQEVGRQLRQGREARGWSTAELAQKLYMRTEQVEALETADRNHLPEMVYVIAQTRRIAKSLGLDANAVIEPLLDIRPSAAAPAVPRAPERARPVAAASPEPRLPVAPTRRGPRRAPLAAAALAVAAAGALLVLQPWKPSPWTGAPARSPAAPPQGAGASPTAAGGDSLRLTAREPTWLEVRDGQGRSLYRGLFQGSSRFSLGQGLELLAGRPDLLLVERAGVAAAPLGRIDELRWVRFSADGTPEDRDAAVVAEPR